MSLPISTSKVTPVVLIIQYKLVVEVIRRGVVSSPFFLYFMIILLQALWRPFASSGLPHPSLPCLHIINPLEGQQEGSCATF
jgi:hypothetical protein